MRTPTEHTVVIEGQRVPVTKDETGRLYARMPECEAVCSGYREWHAKTLEILNQRIASTTAH